METDVDAYFAQNSVPSVVSDMLFELGFHRPKDVGKFIAGYIDRRFQLDGGGGSNHHHADTAHHGGNNQGPQEVLSEEDFSTIEVRTAPGAIGDDDVLACALLEEAQALRMKYRDFEPQDPAGDGAENKGNIIASKVITASEFCTDYERLLVIFGSQQLWSFAERRLALLRGLFDAHCALNGKAEESEALAGPPRPRVDSCVQLARSLAPGRLFDFLRRKTAIEALRSSEVAPGRTLKELVDDLGHPPTMAELTHDADAPLPHTSSLAGVFSRTANYTHGEYLADVTRTSFDLLEATDAMSGGETYAEYRLPLHAESGAWVDLARWAIRSGLRSPRVHWVVQLPEFAYAGLKERRAVLSFAEMLDNAFAPLAATASAISSGTESCTEMSTLFTDVCAFELMAAHGGSAGGLGEHLAQDLVCDPQEWNRTLSPPFAYQLYHVWARLKVLNTSRAAASQSLPAFGLRASANTAEALACAYLLGANGVSRCGALAAHAPLQYLFLLDGVGVTVSLMSRRSLGGAGEAGLRSFGQLFKAGLAVSLCSEDPTVSQQCDDAIGLEYGLARGALSLSQADLAEIAATSVEQAGFPGLRSSADTGRGGDRDSAAQPWPSANPAAGETAPKERNDDAKTIRSRYRAGRHKAELSLVARLAARAREDHAAAHGE